MVSEKGLSLICPLTEFVQSTFLDDFDKKTHLYTVSFETVLDFCVCIFFSDSFLPGARGGFSLFRSNIFFLLLHCTFLYRFVHLEIFVFYCQKQRTVS